MGATTVDDKQPLWYTVRMAQIIASARRSAGVRRHGYRRSCGEIRPLGNEPKKIARGALPNNEGSSWKTRRSQSHRLKVKRSEN